MLTVTDKSALTAFCDRVSKLEDVYIVGERGKNAARARQIWRIDDPDGEGTFDVGDLFRDIESRLLTDPSEEPTFIKCLRRQSGDRMDSVKLSPMDERDSSELENASAVGHMSVGLTAISRELVGSAERQLATKEREISRLMARNDDLVQQVIDMSSAIAQYQVLERVGLRTDQLADQPSEMGEAWAFLQPLLTQVASRLMITGPQEGQEGQEVDPQNVEVDCSGWADKDADAIVALLVAMSRQRPDLVTGARIERLMASPLGKLVANHLMGAK